MAYSDRSFGIGGMLTPVVKRLLIANVVALPADKIFNIPVMRWVFKTARAIPIAGAKNDSGNATSSMKIHWSVAQGAARHRSAASTSRAGSASCSVPRERACAA